MKKTLFLQKLLPLLLSLTLLASLLPLSAFTAVEAEEYDSAGATSFTFTDSGITAADGDYTSYKIDGTALTIKGAGTYIVSGTCADGSITVKKGVTGVTLVLSDLDLTSADTAPIACNKSSGVTIVAAAKTTNTLTDAACNNDETYTDNTNAENAVIKCKDGSQVTLCGSGTLNIVSNGKNGIKSGATTDAEGEAWLVIEDLTLNITASVNDAINAEQSLTILSGNLNISAADDGIHSDYYLTIGAKNTSGPTILVSESNEGIEAATLSILSGDITVHSTDDVLNAANSDLTDYDFSITISGGTLYLDTSAGDGIDSNGTLTISGGTVEVYSVSSGDNQPLDSDGDLSITGGTVLAVGCMAMGNTPVNSQSYVQFSTSSGGFSGMGGFGGMGGRPGQSGSSGSISAGSVLTVKDSSGNTLYSATAVRAASYVIFSSPSLNGGESYTLYSDSSKVSSATATTSNVPEVTYAAGDMNLDGTVDVQDVMTLAQIAAGSIETPTTLPEGGIDLNDDGAVDVTDVMLLAQTVSDSES